MSRTLSQKEIDALLLAAPEAATPVGDIAPEVPRGVTTYNFRRPDRVSAEQLRSLRFLHDRFAKNAATALSAFLRSVTDVSIVSVEQFAYSEFLTSLPDPTAFYAISMHPLDSIGALDLDPAVAFPIVDRLLGGAGKTPDLNRSLTEIEQNVLDSVVKLVLDQLTEVWQSIIDVQFHIHARETRPQMLQVTSPNEIVILVAFEVRVGDARGVLSICVPATSLESKDGKMAQGWHRTPRPPTAAEGMGLRANLGRVPMPVTAMLETRMRARELLALAPGDVMSVGRPVASPVAVHVGHLKRFAGRLTCTDTGVAVRIEHGGGQAEGLVAAAGVEP